MVPAAVREGRAVTLNLPRAFRELARAEPRLRMECLRHSSARCGIRVVTKWLGDLIVAADARRSAP